MTLQVTMIRSVWWKKGRSSFQVNELRPLFRVPFSAAVAGMELRQTTEKIDSLTVPVLSENEPSSMFIDRRTLR